MNELSIEQEIALINAEWIKHMMLNFKIRNPRQLSILANISEPSLNRALNGHREPSSEIKNTLYWYFRTLDAERQIKNFDK